MGQVLGGGPVLQLWLLLRQPGFYGPTMHVPSMGQHNKLGAATRELTETAGPFVLDIDALPNDDLGPLTVAPSLLHLVGVSTQHMTYNQHLNGEQWNLGMKHYYL